MSETTLLPLFSRPAADPAAWMLDPETTFLNHGSFGSCPRAILEFQHAVRAHYEWQPVQFFVRELECLWDRARTDLARFVGAEPADLVFVTNATTGVNTVLRSLRFQPGDELLVSNHEYNACRNALDSIAAREGARVVVAEIPFPLKGSEEVVAAILSQVTPRTRLALIDHVTSQTGIILPLESVIPQLTQRGIDTLVDGAHAPGMIPLDLRQLGATYYTGNCHKWICAPKGAGFLFVQNDRQELIRPLVISHGANSPRSDRSRYLIEFGWTGTWDPSAFLSVAEALRYMSTLMPGGWSEIMDRNRRLTLKARALLCQALGIEPPCPEAMIGSLASLPIPPGEPARAGSSPLYSDPLQDTLRERFRIEVPIIPWPSSPARLIRISAQLYNSFPQYERLAHGLVEALRPQ